MSILKQVTSGKVIQPNLWIVYGNGKTGKSSLAAEGPHAIFIGPESGTANLNVARIPSNSFLEVMEVIKALTIEEHAYKTLAIDSLDWLEPLVWEYVVETVPHEKGHRVKGIEDYGYKAGYAHALTPWRKLIAALNQLREKRGMHIIIIAHPHSKEAKDPTVATEYNRVQLKLHDKAAALWKEYVDCIFFISPESTVAVDKKGKGKAISFKDEIVDRYIYTEWSTAWDAGNRFGLPPRLPYVKGQGWETVMTAISEANPESPEAALAVVTNLAQQITNVELRAKVDAAIEANKTDKIQLERLQAKLRTIISAAPAA